MQATRDRIQAAALINRLQEHSLGDKPTMDQSQVNAAVRLLNKVLPDLSSVQLQGDPDKPIETRIEYNIVAPANED